MYTCPNCSNELANRKGPSGFYWQCPNCNGRSATISLLRRYVPRTVVNEIWQMGQSRHFSHKRNCPACSHKMTEVPTANRASADLVDVCSRCQLVWFDDFEYESLPKIPPPPTEGPISPKAKQTAAVYKALNMRKPEPEAAFGAENPDWAWQWIPGFFGMPIEHEEQNFYKNPWVTWGIGILMVTVTLLTLWNIDSLAMDYGLLPSEYERYGGLTFVTSFFLHGGILHLLGNLYFLLVFGDNVEDELGKPSYILFILTASLFGSLAHILGAPNAETPVIGASGGISGIIAYYALKFPKAKLGFMFHAYIIFKWFRFPAYALFILWSLLQLFLLWQQLQGYSNVSALAHLGGAATGIALWFMTRNINKQASR